ncbi:MAG: hypothetical protein ACXACC_08225, partial [Promethearchaeota archaeon]
MFDRVFLDRFKVILITFLMFLFFLVFELNSLMIEPQDFLNTPINFLRYIPIVFLLYVFVNEIYHSIFRDNTPMKIELKGEGVVFIQNYQVWIAIFETYSLEKIQINELEQLKHLETFSFELDGNKQCLRVFLFSKSHEELKERMNKSKPILENVLPSISPISDMIIARFIRDYSLLKINNRFLLKKESELIIPQFKEVTRAVSSSFSSMILSCNSSYRDEVKGKTKIIYPTQLYFFCCYKKSSLFKCMDENIFKNENAIETGFLEAQELHRARLRYQIEKYPKMELKKGLKQFRIGLTSFISTNNQVIAVKKVSHLPLEVKQIITEKKLFPSNNVGRKRMILKERPSTIDIDVNHTSINQICFEFCNIPKDPTLSSEEKSKRCYRRANFCCKLLANENFSSLLENVLIQEQEVDKIH